MIYMRILFITSSSINGGAQKHIREMFKSLLGLGHNMYIAAPNGWLLDELRDYKDRTFPLDSLKSGVRCISDVMENVKPDITNTFILSGGILGTLAWRKKKYGKLFVTVNNPVIYDGISTIGKLFYPHMYRWMSKYVSAFLVKSDKVRDEVNNIIKDSKPVLSIKNGIDFTIFNKDAAYADLKSELGICKSDIVITNVAVLNERKGQQHLIEAVNILRKRYSIHLMLAGEGPSLQSLVRLTEQLRVQSYVHFLGRRSDINRVLANTDIFVLSSYHEGLPNSLMEAMAMGLPCISTNVGGVEQLITDHLNGIIVESKSSSSIIKALEYFINQKDSARKMGTEAYRKMVTNYRQPIVSKELVDIYINM